MAEYEYRPVDVTASELAAVVGLFAAVWPDARHLTVDYVRWLYAENPNGPVIGYNAWRGTALAGHYVVIPIRARLHGQVVPAALSLNTAVHPAHQGKGLFTELARRTYDEARTRGAHHVIGVANANSTPGFLRKLEFHDLGPLDARILWSAPTLGPRAAPPAWERVWEPHDLAWRIRNPSRPYTLVARHGCRQILAPTGRYGLLALLKLDSPSEAAPLPGRAVHRPLLPRPMLWIGRSARVRFRALGGVRLPNRFRASPLNLIIRYLVPGTPPVAPEAVEFAAIDFDAY